MYTPRKRHLRKKRLFLPKQQIFALFNGSNLKASEISKIRLSLGDAKLYSVPLYLKPPKLGLGCPLIMIVYKTVNGLQANILNINTQLDCLGVSINKKWYSIGYLNNNKIKNLEQKTLALFILRLTQLKKN